MQKTAIVVGIAAVMSLAGFTSAGSEVVEPQRWIVGFYGYPDFVPGDRYGLDEVVEVNNPLKFIVVETLNPVLLQARVTVDDMVRYTEQDHAGWDLYFTPNDPFYTHDAHWGTKRIGGEAAWDVTTGSSAVKVAHIDSGLNKGHEDISNYLQGFDFLNGDNDPEDQSSCNWHGTHTTGTAGSPINNGKGFAGISQHTILPIKIFGGGGGGPFACSTTTSAITNALQYAGDQGAHLSSNSWGGGSSSTAINDAIAYAHGKGTIHVAAAGNSGPCSNCVGQPWKDNPDKSVVVTSLTDGDIFSSFSSQGPEVDVIAPGDFIGAACSGTSDYCGMSGTSMATPHVTGALALYIAATGNTAYSTVTNALASTAENLGFSSDRQGAGLVRADLLVGGGGTPPPNSPPTAAFTESCSGLTCSFTDTSTDSDGTIASWSWDFGDGGTSTAQNPSHTYAADGTYTVTLTVTDDDGATDTTSHSVTASSGGGGDFTLAVQGYKVKGVKTGDLTWSGATSTNVDVYRDGGLVATTANDGFYTDSTGQKGGGSITWRVCEAGTSTCSNDATWNF